MKTVSVKNKIFILFVAVIFISLSVIGWLGFSNAKKAYTQSAFNLHEGKIESLTSKIKGVMDTIPSDLLYNTTLSSLQKYIIWSDINEQEMIQKWEERYINTLKDYIEQKKLFYKISYIDSLGFEKISVKYDTITHKAVVIPKEKLQNRAFFSYFKAAMGLERGEFFISDMELNQEYGKIEKPYVPVLQYASPVINDNGEIKGVILASLRADIILNLIDQAANKDNKKDKDEVEYYLTDKNGYFLYHKDKAKRWGLQLNNTQFHLEDKLIKLIEKSDQNSFIKGDKIIAVKKLYPSKANSPFKYWYLISISNKHQALAELNNFISLFILVTLGIILVSFVLIRGYISKLITPLIKVTSQLKSLSLGEIKKEHIIYNDSEDEIGQMVNSTRILVDAIDQTRKQAEAITQGDFAKEIKLLSANDALGLALKEMQSRLQTIADLAKNLSVGNYEVDVVIKNDNDQLGLTLLSMVNYLQSVTKIAEDISHGNINIKYRVQARNDRLGYAVLGMMKYLKKIEKQAVAIQNEDYRAIIRPQSANDQLAHALVSMTEILRETSYKNKQEIWLSEGISGFNNALTGVVEVEELLQNAINTCSRYVGASSGIIYTFEKTQEQLKQMVSYAFAAKTDTVFNLGEGVIGQVGLEKQSIIVKNIQDNSFDFHSGTVSVKPKELFALPIVYEQELLGVIEIVTLEHFSELEQQYLEKIAHILAISFYKTLQNQQIQKLLEESHKAYEELQVKSEELEAQSEELKASNEQLEEQQKLLQIQSEDLKRKNALVEQAKDEINEKAKDLEATNRYKSEFLANMSHELRTPLNSVILLSSLLIKNNKNTLSEDDIKKAKVINQSGTELLRLINDILDLSKVESGKMELIIDKIVSKDMKQYYEEFFIHSAKDKGLKFEVIDKIQGEFYNDQDRLAQVIRNLISNALKFTKEGGVTLLLEKTQDEKLPIKISVQDTGIGIPKEKQDKIFEAFIQADGSTSREFGGTGLGLSISKDLVELMQGKIELVSEENKGSTFIVSLPNLEQTHQNNSHENIAPKKVEVKKPQESSQDDQKNDIKKILIIEKKGECLELIKKDFSAKIDYTFTLATTIKDAKRITKEHYFDIVIIDLDLEDGNCMEFCKSLNKHRPDSVILIYTKRKLTQEKTESLKEVSDEIIIKNPNAHERLKDEIIRFLNTPKTTSNQQYLQTTKNQVIDTSILKGKKVLIVDDDIKNIFVLTSALQEYSMKISHAKNGKEALEFLKQNSDIDIVLMDIMMPVMDGYEAIKHIRDDKQLKNIPIIAASAKAMEQDKQKALEVGADDYLTKPIDLNKLNTMMVTWINKNL